MQLLILFCFFLSSLECVGKTLLIYFSMPIFFNRKGAKLSQRSQSSFLLADSADLANFYFYLLDLQNLRETLFNNFNPETFCSG